MPLRVALHVHLEELGYGDHACMDLLMCWEQQQESMGGQLYMDWPGLGACFHTKTPRPAAAPGNGALAAPLRRTPRSSQAGGWRQRSAGKGA